MTRQSKIMYVIKYFNFSNSSKWNTIVKKYLYKLLKCWLFCFYNIKIGDTKFLSHFFECLTSSGMIYVSNQFLLILYICWFCDIAPYKEIHWCQIWYIFWIILIKSFSSNLYFLRTLGMNLSYMWIFNSSKYNFVYYWYIPINGMCNHQ